MSSPPDEVPLCHGLRFVSTGRICNQRFHNLVSGEVAVGSIMMLHIGLLILQLKTNILVSASLDVGHVSRSEDKKRIILLGVEREYCMPDVALCGILNLLSPQISNVQFIVLAFRGVVDLVVCPSQPVKAAITRIESRIVWRMTPSLASARAANSRFPPMAVIDRRCRRNDDLGSWQSRARFVLAMLVSRSR